MSLNYRYRCQAPVISEESEVHKTATILEPYYYGEYY